MASSMLLPLLIIGVTYISGSVSYPPSASSASATVNLVKNFNPVSDRSGHSYYPRRQDYTYVDGIGAYKVHTRAADWDTCRRTCAEEHGNLVVINSRRESDAVSQLARNAGAHTGSEYPEYLHIGIHNRFDRNEWVTIDGSSLVAAGFSEWDVGQPNRDDQACGCINYTTGKFDDSACTTALAFVCELPYVGY